MDLERFKIRSAEPVEARALSELAIRSKAHWGYDAAFMDACLAELTLSAAYLRSNPTFVLESSGARLGFYSFESEGPSEADCAEIGLFFVEPEFIGRGAGREMMVDAISRARSRGVVRLTVQSDPHAEPFYRAMGFVPAGERDSASLPGRRLPVLEMHLSPAV